MMVQQTSLDAAANNLANVDTAGFRGRKAIAKSFPEVLMERIDPAKSQGEIPPWPWRSHPIGVASLNQVLSETYMSTEAGNMQVTDGPLDLALEDVNSFFVVMDGEGNQFYTRAGHFVLNQDGQIVTPDGHLLVGEGGPIEVGEAASVAFSDDGQVIADGEAVGRYSLYSSRPQLTSSRQERTSLLRPTTPVGRYLRKIPRLPWACWRDPTSASWRRWSE